MKTPSKVCPVVLRRCEDHLQILVFLHPLAGIQLVKGTIEPGESPGAAAVRELAEESGIAVSDPGRYIGVLQLGSSGPTWAAFVLELAGLPDGWTHRCLDDGGHDFRFGWHPLEADPDDSWHPIFRQALGQIRARLGGSIYRLDDEASFG